MANTSQERQHVFILSELILSDDLNQMRKNLFYEAFETEKLAAEKLEEYFISEKNALLLAHPDHDLDVFEVGMDYRTGIRHLLIQLKSESKVLRIKRDFSIDRYLLFRNLP